MQVKAQADTADSIEAKEHAKAELESLKACPTSCSMSNALTGSLSNQLHLLQLALCTAASSASFERYPHPIHINAGCMMQLKDHGH